jgi:small redox-active disulfide protein 2
MKHIKILGTGCAKCKRLEEKVKTLVISNSLDADVEKITNLEDIMKFNILHTPGLVINGKVVSTGIIPKDEQILNWINEN